VTHLSLFSGIGGIDLAAHRAGFETVAFVEKDEFCQAVLRKNFGSGIPIYGDIRAVDAAGFRGVDLISGGFPCQPWSLAGKQRGAEDDRHLWPEMLRVIALARPAFVLAENVPGLIGLALDDCLSDLEGEGYATRTLVVPACAVGAPHIRSRVFIIARNMADAGGERRQQDASRAPSDEGPDERRSAEADHLTAGDGQGCRDGDVADSDCERQQEWSEPNGEPLQYEQQASQRHNSGRRSKATPNTHSQQEGRTAIPRQECGQWLSEPPVGRVANGIPRRVDRLRALGNAVVPQQVFPILEAIARELRAAQARCVA